eukprot:scaffold3009_cov80-Cylindrotheca_fusiformis.AAC.1
MSEQATGQVDKKEILRVKTIQTERILAKRNHIRRYVLYYNYNAVKSAYPSVNTIYYGIYPRCLDGDIPWGQTVFTMPEKN